MPATYKFNLQSMGQTKKRKAARDSWFVVNKLKSNASKNN